MYYKPGKLVVTMAQRMKCTGSSGFHQSQQGVLIDGLVHELVSSCRFFCSFDAKKLFCTQCIFRLESPTPQRSSTMSQQDHHANQSNPNNPAHQAAQNNRANQMNPNNPAFQSSRQGGKKGK